MTVLACSLFALLAALVLFGPVRWVVVIHPGGPPSSLSDAAPHPALGRRRGTSLPQTTLKGITAMQLHNFVADALDRVLMWDLPEEAYADALSSEAGHLAALDSDQTGAEPD